jgi:hypothetical protein
MSKRGRVRDLRTYMQRTNLVLILGGLLLVLVGGNLLVWLLYGSGTALQSLTCMVVLLIPVGLIVVILWMMDWVVRRERDG